MKNKNVLYLTQAAMIAALYVVLTMIANALGIASGNSNAQLSILRPGKSHAVTAHALPTPITPTITATPANNSTVFFSAAGSTYVRRLSQ